MNKSYLLPYKFKKIGAWMFLPFFAAGIWLLFISKELECGYLRIPALAISITQLFDEHATWFEIIDNDPINEIIMIGMLVSLCFLALSKEKDEDEMTGQIRMQSFVWSLWVTAAILAFGILFLYMFSFLYFSFAAIFFVFFIYILKFNLTMRKIRRTEK